MSNNPGRNLQAILNYNFAQLEALQDGDLTNCDETSNGEFKRTIETAKATALLTKSVLDVVSADMAYRQHMVDHGLEYEGGLEWQAATITKK